MKTQKSYSRIARTRAAALVSCFTLLATTEALKSADQWVTITDPQDMGDTSGDIRSVSARVKGDNLYLSMTVEKSVAPSVEQTPEGMVNRYYYHWLLDTDNNPATGRSNAEYEGSPTELTKPIGYERVVMLGWRDGKPNGVEVYDPANEDVAILENFAFQASGNTVTAVVPLAALGLSAGQTIAVSAFQEGASESWKVDWVESATITLSGLPITEATVSDPADMGDTSGDIRGISAHVEGDNLVVSMTVQGVAGPSTDQTPEGMSNRYYYHWLLDTDNNPATGRSNAEYEGNPTGLSKPIGYERVIMIGWRDGKVNGLEVYDPANEDVAILTAFQYHASGNTLTAMIPLSALGVSPGQTVALSAFQEGASESWKVDWVESATLTLKGPALAQAQVDDPADMGDPSGDIRAITAHVEGESLLLTMTVQGAAAPSIAQTTEGMVNRYYYHWLLDTDNNPATGRSNAEYEGSPTGLAKPIGYERVIMVGWRDGNPNGVEVYDPANEDVALMLNFPFQARGNTLTAVVPLEVLGLALRQTIAVSAFQEGASESWKVDWVESQVVTLDPPAVGRMKIDGDFTDWAEAAAAGSVTSVEDPADLGDTSGDIRQIQATVEEGYLYLRMSVEGIALPSVEETPEGKSNRYYYHWLLDTDNNPATGRSNAEYEGSPTGLEKPIGYERVVMIGWRDGEPNGLEVYDPANEDVAILSDFEYSAGGASVEARVKLADIGLTLGQTIAISAFQEGASDSWAVDWVESKVMTLAEAGANTMALENLFSGNSYGYTITLEDAADLVVDASTVLVRFDGEPVDATVVKQGSTTRISGIHSSLLEAGSSHTISVSVQASGEPQFKDYVFKVDPYTVLPLTGALQLVDTNNVGFVANVSQIGVFQSGSPSVHSNIADLAEMQLAGQLTNELGSSYYNEVELIFDQWAVEPVTVTNTINWFELAPEQQASLNFQNDEPFPKLSPWSVPNEGVAMDVSGYIYLPQGYHKFGVYTEGGHRVYAGLTNTAPVLSVFDNSTADLVPTYFGRNQFFDVVAPEDGYYPIRLLYFQSQKRQEPGLMLEFFTEKDRVLHLVNDKENPSSLMAFRAGSLVGNSAATVLTTQSQNNSLVIQYTGMLQWANSPDGPWHDYADASQSPVEISTTGNSMFFRSKSY